MAMGSVRKKGKKWYYRYYVEDASGNFVQKECVGTESKTETEKLLRQAMSDYEEKSFIASSDNITLGQLLDIWVEEDLRTSTLSNNTIRNYILVAERIKTHPLANRKLKTITIDHMQHFLDLVTFGGKEGDFESKGFYTKGRIRGFYTVLNRAYKMAIFPKKYVTVNPMQYVTVHTIKDDSSIFSDNSESWEDDVITKEQYEKIIDYVSEHHPDAVLAIQIAYYTGLRIGEVAGLTWQDINLREQHLTVRRSVGYNCVRHTIEIGPTKRAKVRVVEFGDTLAKILRKAYKDQKKRALEYGVKYKRCYYREVKDKNRIHYEYSYFDGTKDIPAEYTEIDFVSRRRDGRLLKSETVNMVCYIVAHSVEGMDGFHFHMLRHTYSTNLIKNGAMPKDVQELLGHSDVSTTMNIYVHGSRDSKKASVRTLDEKIV